MRIGIVSVCDVHAFLEYLDESAANKIQGFRKNAAPSVNNLILGLLKRGYKIVLFTTDASVDYLHLKGPLLDIYVVKAFNNYPLKHFIKVLVDGRKLGRLIKSKVAEIDVLHAHWTYEFALGAVRVADEIPVFCTIRDWAPRIFLMEKFKDKFHWLLKMFISSNILRNSKVFFIANSEYIAERVYQSYGRKIPILYNILNSNYLRASSHRNKGTVFTFLAISMTLDKWKNINTLLQAFKLMTDKFENVQLVLIGPPFHIDDFVVKKWISKGYITDKVILAGKVTHKDLPKYIDKCSVLVQPSIEESFGNTVIEAMSRGLAVIGGQNSGAIPFLLEQGKSGCLCDVRDPNSIFEAMSKLYLDENYRKQIISNAYKSIARFDEQVIINKHLDMYHSSLKEAVVA